MTDTERITHRIMDQYEREMAEYVQAGELQGIHGMHSCRTDGCTTIVGGSEYCPKCEENRDQQQYVNAMVLLESPFWPWLRGIVAMVRRLLLVRR